MKIIVKFAILWLLTAFLLSAKSQTLSENSFSVTSANVVRNSDKIFVSMDFELDKLNIKSNDMLILTPVLKSNNNSIDSLRLSPLVITGSTRNKIVTRGNNLNNELPFWEKPQSIVKRKNNTLQTVNYITTIPYEGWMDNASLLVDKIVVGCANCFDDMGNLLVMKRVLGAHTPASYRLTFIVPNVEPVKARSDRYSAAFNFIVNRYELLRDYKNNATEFDKVDKIIGEVKNNTDLQITKHVITGYASPEGVFDHNRKLAENRANSFANYLVTKFAMSRNDFTVQGMGEDWTGLRKVVSESNLTDRQAIIDIIDKVENPDARNSEMVKLSGGQTYRTLLKDYYPPLRRTEYIIEYVVRAFNVEEAREIIKKNPKQLSLNEMYLVAKSYPSNSKEFKEVFDIAISLYPDSEIAIVNTAAVDIENKDFDAAIKQLNKIENKPSSWNNLGVAYALKGDISTARYYFEKAIGTGDKNALTNLTELQKKDE